MDRNTLKRARQRGATMVSVMLLTVSMITVGVLVMKTSSRDIEEAGTLVARERALMSAQAAVDLAAAHYRVEMENDPNIITTHLAGYSPQANADICDNPLADCIPGAGPTSPWTGQRNSVITGKTDCSGQPCMRPGAIVRLPDAGLNTVDWAQVPASDLLLDGDSEAVVTVWVRNNTSEVLGSGESATPGDWITDGDRRVVITAMATVRNTTVAVEQEMLLAPGNLPQVYNMGTPDEGYGGGHNNDNAAVNVCQDNYAAGQG